MGEFFHVDGKQLDEQYRNYLSGFHSWDQLDHADDWILFPENLGEQLSIDETALSQGELYTVLTNKAAKGKKGALVAMIKGTNSEKVKEILKKIPLRFRNKVKEITLDMAPSMENTAKYSFPNAKLVTDRFHVQQLAFDAVQEIRIKHRWEAIDQENKEIELAKETGRKHVPYLFDNGDTLKKLRARSRYLLFKAENKWTVSQGIRASILFEHFPDIKFAYYLARELGKIYQTTREKGVAFTRLARWYDKIEQAGIKSFNTISRTIQNHYQTILNYFDNRSTNASAESFNAKIKAFRSQFRGVRNIPFFLFRLSKIYA